MTVEEPTRDEHPLWAGLARRLETTTVSGAVANGLGPLTALTWRSRGRSVPSVLLQQERAARISQRFAPALLARIAAAFDGPTIVFKGPEVAARYPAAARNFSDLDLLVRDAEEAQRALLAAGFVEVEGEESNPHHLVPLRWPTLPLRVEIHTTLKWPRALERPDVEPIFAEAVPALATDSGMRAPAPHHHALILAAHSWAHTPLRSARDIVDVAAVSCDADDDEIRAVADQWGLSRVWQTTEAAAEWLWSDTRRPLAVSVWARHLIELRDATVLEAHLERWLSPFWALSGRAAFSTARQMLAHELAVGEDETRRDKLVRTARAARHAFTPKSKYGWTNETPVANEPESPPTTN